jgi:VanZ family protein
MCVWAVALFAQSSIPGDRIPDIEFFTHDKLIHFLIYVVFAAAVHRAVRFQDRYPLLAEHHYFFTVLIVTLYGASDEVHQYFVPNRNCSVYDWLADTVGGIAVVAFHWLKCRLKPEVRSA